MACSEETRSQILLGEQETCYTVKNFVFWDVTPRGSCNNRPFGGT
jgi:hypothetical protein